MSIPVQYTLARSGHQGPIPLTKYWSNLIKTTYSYLISYHSDDNKILHNKILHILVCAKFYCDGIIFSINYSNDNFLRVGTGSKFHKWDWCKVWCHCMQPTVYTMLNSCNEKRSIKAYSGTFYPNVSHSYSVQGMPDMGNVSPTHSLRLQRSTNENFLRDHYLWKKRYAINTKNMLHNGYIKLLLHSHCRWVYMDTFLNTYKT